MSPFYIFHFIVHYPTRDLQGRLGLLRQGVTIFTITINNLNAEKNPSPAMTWTPGNMQARHASWEPHTNRGGIFFYILPYFSISDFSWLNVYFIVHYPTRDLQRKLRCFISFRVPNPCVYFGPGIYMSPASICIKLIQYMNTCMWCTRDVCTCENLLSTHKSREPL